MSEDHGRRLRLVTNQLRERSTPRLTARQLAMLGVWADTGTPVSGEILRSVVDEVVAFRGLSLKLSDALFNTAKICMEESARFDPHTEREELAAWKDHAAKLVDLALVLKGIG